MNNIPVEPIDRKVQLRAWANLPTENLSEVGYMMKSVGMMAMELEEFMLKQGHDRSRKQIRYVVGFMFDDNGDYVSLIEKIKPPWQAGKLNGIGGKIDANETPIQAMCREFKEEAGVETLLKDWRLFNITEGEQWEVYFFVCFNTAYNSAAKTQEEEKVYKTKVFNVVSKHHVCCPQVYWLVPMAMDSQVKSCHINYLYDWENPSRVCEKCNKPEIECKCK